MLVYCCVVSVVIATLNTHLYNYNKTELIETLNRKMRVQGLNDCDEEMELELKKTCVDIFQALLEGQGRKVAVYERVLSVIHIDIIEMMSKPPKPKMVGKRSV